MFTKTGSKLFILEGFHLQRFNKLTIILFPFLHLKEKQILHERGFLLCYHVYFHLFELATLLHSPKWDWLAPANTVITHLQP